MSTPRSKAPVVAGLDSSANSLRALDWAVRECGVRHAPLRLVSVAAFRAQREALGRVLTTAEERCHELDPEVAVLSAEVLSGEPADALVASSAEAQLVVVGSRGMGGFRGLVLGSVSTVLASRASCPVAVVRGRELDEITLRHAPVVVGIAGGAPDEATLEFALRAASERGVDLVAVHTWRASETEHAEMVISPLLDWNQMQEREQRTLAEGLAGSRENYPDVSIEQVVHRDHPVTALTTAGNSAQLIVVGSRGRTRFPALHLGSVTNGVLHHATCPVVVVRAENDHV
ncbi:universal stress protein [Parasphingorhabdus pacifica]